MSASNKILRFDFEPGFQIAGQYEIIKMLGSGWEGEVYLVEEIETRIHRAIKFFYPKRNPKNRVVRHYANKLHRLRTCPVLIQYMSQDFLYYKGVQVAYLISEFVEGRRLDQFILRQKGKRLSPFQGVHLLYSIVKGLEPIHHLREYHGDLHTENIIVLSFGLNFEIKLLDMFHWGAATNAHYQDDLHNAIKILYEVLGGKKHYATLPPGIKDICLGLRKDLIVKKFRNISGLRQHLETFSWDLG